MSAGIPIVPIVIRNAEVIAARDSSTFNPGTVDVVVYPPIPIDDWTHENLPERIAEVRQLYLDTLRDWPHDELPAPDLYQRAKAPAKKAPAKKAPPPRRPPPRRRAAKKAPAKKAAAAKKTRPRRRLRRRPPSATGTKGRP